MNSCFVTELSKDLVEPLRQGLLEQGFVLSTPPHTYFQGKKKGVNVTLYQSLKLTVQGKEKDAFIEFFLEPQILKAFPHTHPVIDTHPHIGVDESGKGDFFGPLCVAGVFATSDEIQELRSLGVQDSKKMKDKTIADLAKKISKRCAHKLVCIYPPKYNELYTQFGNLNLLLGWGHATVIEQLVTETLCDDVVIDQFAAEHVVERALQRKKLRANLTQRPRAEEDLVVAAASILARAAFVYGLQKIGNEVGIELPKGASAKVLSTGRKLVSLKGPEVLNLTAKTHFKTYREILS